MQPNSRSTVLVVEDQPEIARLITKALQPSHNVQWAQGVLEGFNVLESETIDLVLLDILLPGTSGFELCQRMKSDVFLRHTPVIFVTGLGGVEDKVRGLGLGADDYLSKPFKVEELVARVDAAIQRNSVSLEANPLSKLPGNGTIEREILKCIHSEKKFSVLYADLNDFKAYNDFYGFYRGDWVIRETAEILLESAKGRNNVIGHIGGDDFVVITEDENPDKLCQDIIQNFDKAVSYFYDEQDRRAGFITTQDRRGKMHSFPLLSIAIGVVTNKIRPLRSVGEVATIGAEVKGVAKRQKGSSYFIDRRKDKYAAPQSGGETEILMSSQKVSQ